MKRKYIKRTYCLTFMCLFLIFSCQNKKTIANHKKGELVLASGGKYYGGVFRINETEYFRSLYPLNITEVVSHRIINQVYEGLVSLNQSTLDVEPCLAESYTVSKGATVYVFNIRKGVHFQDDPCFVAGKGREITSKDFK